MCSKLRLRGRAVLISTAIAATVGMTGSVALAQTIYVDTSDDVVDVGGLQQAPNLPGPGGKISLPEAAPQCGDWDLVPTPNVGNRSNFLTAVTALSANDAWSVGLWRDVSGVFGPMAMRWNGTLWSLTDLPDTSHLGGLPETNGVEATSDGDVWVVGKVFTGYPTDQLPLLLRWRGDTWDYVNTMTLRPQTVYPFGPRGGILYEVGALAPDNIWAVGLASGYGDGGATTVPLAAHWDGSTWTDVEVPRVSNRHHELNDVVAISHDDVWAVGDYRNVAGAFHAVTYHWDGSSWSHIDSPIEHMPGDSGLDDVAATGPNDVWAIGGALQGDVVLMHWDGSQWSLAQPPPNSGGSLAAVGPNDLWVSGWNGFWHWDGSAWTEVPAAVPGATYVIRGGGMEIVGDCDIWCVGFWTLEDGITGSTLAERLTPTEPIPGDIDGDGDVDLSDLATLLAAYGTCAGDPYYDPDADLDASGCVDLSDLATLLAAYGTHA